VKRRDGKMTFTWDPIYIVNLVLCIVILALGYWSYRRRQDKMPLYIGLAFGFFAISHLATILGLKEVLESSLMTVRASAYLIVIITLYSRLKRAH
jgi:lipopolysaccharide export LptBFGC system permease protein LptF